MLDQAPPARITVLHCTEPFSVTTADIRPPLVSTPRTAVYVKTLAPSRRAARAMAGAAIVGSARPSVGV